jgi:hypothetical protein
MDQQIYIHPVRVSFAIKIESQYREPDEQDIRDQIADEIDFNPSLIEFEYDGPPQADWMPSGGEQPNT